MFAATTGPTIKLVLNPENSASTFVLIPVKRKKPKKKVRKAKKPKSIYGRVVEP